MTLLDSSWSPVLLVLQCLSSTNKGVSWTADNMLCRLSWKCTLHNHVWGRIRCVYHYCASENQVWKGEGNLDSAQKSSLMRRNESLRRVVRCMFRLVTYLPPFSFCSQFSKQSLINPSAAQSFSPSGGSSSSSNRREEMLCSGNLSLMKLKKKFWGFWEDSCIICPPHLADGSDKR